MQQILISRVVQFDEPHAALRQDCPKATVADKHFTKIPPPNMFSAFRWIDLHQCSFSFFSNT
jgi:hypothetical protein